MFNADEHDIYCAIACEISRASRYTAKFGDTTERISYGVQFDIPAYVLTSPWVQSPHGPSFLDTLSARASTRASFGLLHGRRCVSIHTLPDERANPLSERFNPGLIAATVTKIERKHHVAMHFGECRVFRDLIPWIYAVRERALEFMPPDFNPTRLSIHIDCAIWNYAHWCYILPFLDMPVTESRANPDDIRDTIVRHLQGILDESGSDLSRKRQFLDAATNLAFRETVREWLCASHV